MGAIDQFLADEAILYKKAIEKIAGDPLIFAGLKKWDIYDEKEKIGFLERFARLLAQEVTPNLSPDIELFQAAPVPGSVEAGNFSASRLYAHNDTIRLNRHPDVLAQSPLEEQLNTIAHEMTHKRQTAIIKRPELAGEKHKSTVAALFVHDFAHYISGQSDYAAYRSQPIEAHAFAMGDLSAATMAAFAARKQLIPNPSGDSGRQLEFQMNSVSPSHTLVSPSCRNGIVDADPHVHYWSGRSTEVKLARPGNGKNRSDWSAFIGHYVMAVKCGEFVRGFNPEQALERLHDAAQGHVFIERPGSDGRSLQTPPDIQRAARQALEKFTQSPVDGVRLRARTCLKKLELHEKRLQKQQTQKNPVPPFNTR